MVSSILGQVTSQLERRFVLNALFPTLVFFLALGLAVSAGDAGPAAAIRDWERDPLGIRFLIAIGSVGLVFLGANILSNSSQLVVVFFEGYLPPVSWLGGPARSRQLARAHALLEEEESAATPAERSRLADRFETLFPTFPLHLTREDMAPTRLGNLLKSAETYPRERYGVDAIRVWPRLYPLLPGNVTSSLVAARSSMEFLLSVSLLSVLYVPLASIYMIAAGAPLIWILTGLGVGSLISFATYFASFAPTVSYGEQLRSAFDLHRLDLLRETRLPMPRTLDEERAAWRNLILHLERGEPDPNWRFAWVRRS
jgi:hypothetical protein